MIQNSESLPLVTEIRNGRFVTGPACLYCQKGIRMFNDSRCEDCWAWNQQFLHGCSQAVQCGKVYRRITDPISK